MFVEKLGNKLGLMFIWPESSTSETNVDDEWKAYDSTDRRTCIDWCMYRRRSIENERDDEQSVRQAPPYRLKVYESWFSDHKPLWLEIKFY